MDYKAILINGVRNLVYLCVGIIVGVTWLKSQEGETSAERLVEDSKLGVVVANRTEELKDEVEVWLENNDPVDADGNPTDEWLQFLERQREIAKRRGNKASLLSRLPEMR